jgi:Vam6/Vps39-like protein vacuolar protein sorting-associated protein 39
VISYLERMIENEGEELDVEFHNELVHQYVEHAERYASSTNEVPIERETSSKRKSLRTRLMNFLSSENARYDAKQMLEEFPPTKLLEERALLLRRVGLHDRALHIYVHKLKSLNLAEKYCDQVYTTKKSDVYVALIRTCLRKPPDEGDDSKNDEKKRVHDAIELMCKYHDRIDPVKVLSLLPVTTPVSELRKYLKFTFSRRDHDRRTVPVERELRKLECLDLEQRLSKLRSRSVTLRSEDKCSNCSRLIDNVSFSVLMDKETGEIGDIVHFRCKCSNHSDDLLDKEEE